MEYVMPDVLAAAAEYGGYVSPIKFAVFLILYFGWLFIIDWVYKDSEALGTKHTFWTGVVFGVWAAAGIIWLLIPVFVIGLAFYIIAAGAATISYVMHRNSLVPEFQRILTFDYIKDLASWRHKEEGAGRGICIYLIEQQRGSGSSGEDAGLFRVQGGLWHVR